jgi:hypothetical protein
MLALRRSGLRLQSTLAGSVPAYDGHLVVHSPMPSSEWPKQIEDLPLLGAVSKALQPSNIGLSLSTPLEPSERAETTATLYDSLGSLPLPFEVASNTIQQLQDFLATRSTAPRSTLSDLHLYVCTHGNRDCRCGTIGGEVYKRLVKDRAKWSSLRDLKVAEISHVGKHIFAANVLVYPKADWYGSISVEDVPRLYRAILFPTDREPVWIKKWRGRLGLRIDEQKALYERMATGHIDMSKSNPYRSAALGDPVTLQFKRYDGSIIEGQGFEGETVKDVAKRLDLVEAICGGIQECATCAMQ